MKRLLALVLALVMAFTTSTFALSWVKKDTSWYVLDEAKGEYLIFLDSDDYIEKDLLKKINDSIKDNPDVVRFQIKEV